MDQKGAEKAMALKTFFLISRGFRYIAMSYPINASSTTYKAYPVFNSPLFNQVL